MKLSIIIPVYNEQDNLKPLLDELNTVRKIINADTEVIFVDDGSTDSTNSILKEFAANNKSIKLIAFNRNYGQTQAIAAGIANSKGDTIILMDSDLQNDPKDIPALLAQLNNYDVASGWRKNRKDKFFTRILPSNTANFLISFFTGVKLHDYGCTLKAYKKEFLSSISIHGEMHRFLPAYCAWQGAKICEVIVNHRARKSGKSKYGLNRIFKVILDLLVVKFLLSYLTKPIYVFGGTAIISFILGAMVYLFVIIRKLFYSGEWLSPLFFVGLILWFLSILCLLMGLLAEVMVRMYFESRGYSVYRIKEKNNI